MCLSSESTGSSSARQADNIRPLEMEGKSVVQFLFWNRFHSIKIAQTKLEHEEEAILNFYKEFFMDILQFISTAVTL